MACRRLNPEVLTSDPVKLRSQITCLRQRIEDLLMFNKLPVEYTAQILGDMLTIIVNALDKVEGIKDTSDAINAKAYRIEQRMKMVEEPDFEQSEEYDPVYDDEEDVDGKLDASADNVVEKS